MEGREEGDEAKDEITLNHVTIAFAALVLYGWAKFAVVWFLTDGKNVKSVLKDKTV